MQIAKERKVGLVLDKETTFDGNVCQCKRGFWGSGTVSSPAFWTPSDVASVGFFRFFGPVAFFLLAVKSPGLASVFGDARARSSSVWFPDGARVSGVFRRKHCTRVGLPSSLRTSMGPSESRRVPHSILFLLPLQYRWCQWWCRSLAQKVLVGFPRPWDFLCRQG